MIPKRIVLENFLSFGSPATEIEFPDDEPLWVLGGANGVGKSAVFDAMTYALYGEHRGGAMDHASLVRHGANGFRVTFEFEFNGASYQITRNRPLTGRPTQSVKQWIDGGWNRTVPLPHAAGRQDSVKLWAERTLGLGFDAFTASVLLRQGHADAIITAGGTERLKILKKIIGAERYEILSARVHAAARRCKERHESRCDERDTLTRERGTPPTLAELQAASDALARAEEKRTTAHTTVIAAQDCRSAAKSWAALDAQSRGLKGQIEDAEKRAAAAECIRRDKERLDDLTAAAPVLRELLSLRESMSASERKLAERQVEAKQLADALRARELREQVVQDVKSLDAVIGVKKLQDELSRFEPNLGELLVAARKRVEAVSVVATTALEQKAAAAERLGEARRQQQKFADVGIGVPCSLCRQEVTAEHAERERENLAVKVQEFEQKWLKLEEESVEAARVQKGVTEACDRLEKLIRKRDEAANLLADKQRTLQKLGMTAEPDELQGQIADKTAEAERLEGAAGTLVRLACATLKTRLSDIENHLHSEEKSIATVRGQQSTLRERLSPVWKDEVDHLDATAVDAFDSERQLLTAAGVAEQYRRLEDDAVRRQEWLKQLAEIQKQIDEIAPAARIPVADAEEGVRLSREATKSADDERERARESSKALAELAAEHARLTVEIGKAERQADLHRKLDDLLGKGGLQRELVRTAEREIVRLANDTVQNLSDGDLTVELDDGESGDDEAFALRVRRADGPTPIGVCYLSGSQKFRVAVSVALAIGRFAAGQARPLESVIIDEGFGSLDRNGLRAAADELNRLRQYLRRIVVVSHQEEFVGQFRAVIQLTQGENGTTAIAVRQ